MTGSVSFFLDYRVARGRKRCLFEQVQVSGGVTNGLDKSWVSIVNVLCKIMVGKNSKDIHLGLHFLDVEGREQKG